MNTQTRRIPLTDPAGSLEDRINNECDVMLAAGFKLAAATAVQDQLLMVFQKV